MKVLITGFEPFDDSPINPSQNLVNKILDDSVENIQLTKLILPVDKDRAPNILVNAITNHSPDAALAFGFAMGRPKIALERVALNLMDFRIPDNAGIKVRDQPVVKNGPAAYFSTLPVRALIEALRTAGIPSELSLSAGSYLCNQVFYSMMHHITINNFEIRAGFIHLPALPEQAAAIEKPIPSLGLEIEVQALRIMLSTLINTPQR